MNEAKNEYMSFQTIINLIKPSLSNDLKSLLNKYINALIKLESKINKLDLKDKVLAKKDNAATKHIAWRIYDLIKDNIEHNIPQDNALDIINRELKRISIYSKNIKKNYKEEYFREDIIILLAKYFSLNEMDYKCALNYKSVDNNTNNQENIIRIPNIEEYSRKKYSY